jgi:autotransporter-associated beta strand protein
MKNRHQKNHLLAAITMAGFTLAAPSAFAANLYWDSNGTGTAGAGDTPNGTWGTDAFWTTDSTGADIGSPVLVTNGTNLDDYFFSAGTDAVNPYSVSLNDATINPRSVTFEDGTVTIDGGGANGRLSITHGGGITVADTTVTGATISSNLTISGNNTFNVAGSRTLTLDGTSLTRSSRATLNVQGNGTVISTLANLNAAALSNGILGPWASLGTGAPTTYATIDGSDNVVAYTAGTSVSNASGVTDMGGTFNYDVADVGALGAGASVNTLRYTGAAGTIEGDLATKGIMNAGTGALIFSGAVTAGASGTEMVINTANAGMTFNGVFTGAIVKTGSGTMTLSGTPLHVLGAWTVNQGVLALNSATNAGTEVIPGGTVNGGATARLVAPNKVANGAIFTINAGGIFDLNGQADLIGGISGSGSIITTGAPTFQLGNTTQTFSGVISGGLNLVKRNGGNQTLSGANTFTGTTTLNNPGTNATLTLANPLAIQNSALNTTGTSLGTTAIGLRTTVTTLTLGGLIGDKNLASVFRQDSTGGPGGTTALGGYSGVTALTLNPAASVTRSYSAIIADGALGMTLTKTGAGTQVLSGANTYTGGTTLTTGTLQFAKTNSMPATGAVDVGTGATLAVNAGDTANGEFSNATSGAGSIGGLLAGIGGQGAAVSYTGDVRLGIDTTNAVGSVSYAGAIADVGTTLGLTKLGTNTLTLAGNNTYSANTTISAGALRLENPSAVQNSPLIAISGNTLEIATDTAFSGPNISVQAGTIVSDRANPGAGLTHVLGDATIGNGITNFTAGSNVTSGTAAIQLGNISNNNGSVASPRLNPTTANLIITGGVTLGTSNAGTANLTLDGTGSVNSIAGAIVNGTRVTGNVIKSGTSTWTLSGPNTYTGDTTVNDGVLAVTGSSIPDTGKLLINGSGIVNLTGTETVAALDFDGTPQPNGFYSNSGVPPLATITTASFSGGGTLTVGPPPAAGYSAWASLNGAGPNLNDDHDNDGVDNGVEYFIGGPTGNTTGFTPLPGVTNTGGTLSVTWTKAAGYTGTYGTDFVVQTSSTLSGIWTNEILSPDPGFTVVITGNDVKYTFPAGTKNFARLKVTGP